MSLGLKALVYMTLGLSDLSDSMSKSVVRHPNAATVAPSGRLLSVLEIRRSLASSLGSVMTMMRASCVMGEEESNDDFVDISRFQ